MHVNEQQVHVRLLGCVSGHTAAVCIVNVLCLNVVHCTSARLSLLLKITQMSSHSVIFHFFEAIFVSS